MPEDVIARGLPGVDEHYLVGQIISPNGGAVI